MTRRRILVSVLALTGFGIANPTSATAGSCDPGGIPNRWIPLDPEVELAAAANTLRRYGIDIPSMAEYENRCEQKTSEACYVYEIVKDTRDTTYYVHRQVWGYMGYNEPVYSWNPYVGWVQTGCRPVMGWQPFDEEHTKSVPYIADETNAIYVQSCVYHRGWLNMDSNGEVLWDADYRTRNAQDQYNLYYKYAKSLEEAFEFLLAHEFAHYSGVMSENGADTFARRVIVEVRKMKQPKRGPYRVLTYDTTYSGRNKQVACTTAWVPPPLDNLPSDEYDGP
jgi:hypothetical protein